MKFCPKCGSIMRLQRQGGSRFLVCTNPGCGYRIEAEPEALREYRSVSRPDAKARVVTTGKVSEIRSVAGRREEMEQAKEDYYEILLDNLNEYGE